MLERNKGNKEDPRVLLLHANVTTSSHRDHSNCSAAAAAAAATYKSYYSKLIDVTTAVEAIVQLASAFNKLFTKIDSS